ncbi:MAG: DUF1232 domain-containing protein [Abditibacteriaceae bacterium]
MGKQKDIISATPVNQVLTKLQSISRTFKTELKVYRLVLKDSRTPRVSRILLGFAIGYLLLPFDIIPDFIPVLGQLDDVIIVPSLVAFALNFIPQDVIDSCRQQAEL